MWQILTLCCLVGIVSGGIVDRAQDVADAAKYPLITGEAMLLTMIWLQTD